MGSQLDCQVKLEAARKAFFFTVVGKHTLVAFCLLLCVFISYGACANIAKFLERDASLTMTSHFVNNNNVYKRTIASAKQTTKIADTAQTPDTSMITPDTPDTPDTKDLVATANQLEITSGDESSAFDGSGDDDDDDMTPRVAINLSSMEETGQNNNTSTTVTTTQQNNNKPSASSRLKKSTLSASSRLNHAMLDSFLTLYGRSSILKDSHSKVKRSHKHLKPKTATIKSLKKEASKKLHKNALKKDEVSSLLVEPSGVGKKATKKQLLDTPQNEGLGGEPIGEIGPETAEGPQETPDSPEGLGGEMGGVPTGMGAGAEPLGAYDQRSTPNQESQTPMDEAGTEVQGGPLGFTGRHDEEETHIDTINARPQVEQSPFNTYKTNERMSGAELAESPTDLRQSTTNEDKSVNIQGDHEVGEMVSQQREMNRPFSPSAQDERLQEFSPNNQFRSAFAEEEKDLDTSMGIAKSEGMIPRDKSEDNFWNKNGNIQFIDSQQGDKDLPQSANTILRELDKEAEEYDKENNAFDTRSSNAFESPIPAQAMPQQAQQMLTQPETSFQQPQQQKFYQSSEQKQGIADDLRKIQEQRPMSHQAPFRLEQLQQLEDSSVDQQQTATQRQQTIQKNNLHSQLGAESYLEQKQMLGEEEQQQRNLLDEQSQLLQQQTELEQRTQQQRQSFLNEQHNQLLQEQQEREEEQSAFNPQSTREEQSAFNPQSTREEQSAFNPQSTREEQGVARQQASTLPPPTKQEMSLFSNREAHVNSDVPGDKTLALFGGSQGNMVTPLEMTAISSHVLNMEQVAMEKRKRKRKRKRTNVINSLMNYIISSSGKRKSKINHRLKSHKQ